MDHLLRIRTQGLSTAHRKELGRVTFEPSLCFLSGAVTLPLPRLARRVFVGALTKLAAQAGGKRDGRFAEAVAHVVCGGQGALPAVVAMVVQQVHLRLLLRPSGNMDA